MHDTCGINLLQPLTYTLPSSIRFKLLFVKLWTAMVLLGGLAGCIYHAHLRYCHSAISHSFSHSHRCPLRQLYSLHDCIAWTAIFLQSDSIVSGQQTLKLSRVIISLPPMTLSGLELMHAKDLRRTPMPRPPSPACLTGVLSRLLKKTRFMFSNKQESLYWLVGMALLSTQPK